MAGKMAQEAIDWLNKYSDKDYSEYIDEIQSGGKSDQLVREYMMQRANMNPTFKAFLMQIEDGIKDFDKYLEQDKTKGVQRPPTYPKTQAKAKKVPSFFK